MVTVDDSSLVPAFANFSLADSSSQAVPEAAQPEAPNAPAASYEAPKVHAAPPLRQSVGGSADRVFASPLARKLLRESGKSVRRPYPRQLMITTAAGYLSGPKGTGLGARGKGGRR